MRRILAAAEFLFIYLLGKVCGISWVVRYLRNPNPAVTVRLLRAFKAQIGNGSTFRRSLFIDNSYEGAQSTGDFRHLQVGDGCYVGDCTFFDLSDSVILEDNVVVSGRAAFVTHADCNRSEYLTRKFPTRYGPVRVCCGAWIAFGATILPGVTVGRASVVGADSLVRGDVEAHMLYAGTPAKKIRDLEDAKEEDTA